MIAQEFIAQLAAAISVGGTEGVLLRAKLPGDAGVRIEFLMKHPGVRDEAIVNSYGVDALILTIALTPELLATPPEKFDRVRFDAPLPGAPFEYALDAVLLRQVNNTPVAFTAYVRGKGT